MAWLWTSWREYVDAVHPCLADSPGLWRLTQQESWLEIVGHLWEQVHKLTKARAALLKLGFTGDDRDRLPDDSATLEKTHPVVMDAIFAGERLLLYHKRLARSDASYGFLHQNELLNHWDRYEQSGRIAGQIHQLSVDIAELLQGFHDLLKAEEDFMVAGIELPSELDSDFRAARHLFSIGFEEIGLLIAGRGLEGVLRKIALMRKIAIEVKNKPVAAYEADFYDLIEAMYQIRWKAKGERLVDTETRSLLHYLRALRNAGAHPKIRGTKRAVNCRETAVVIADTANRLWTEASTRAKLAPLLIVKNW